MRCYGPLPNLWEKVGQGEKVLSRVKPLHNSYRAGWQRHLLCNVLDSMALDRIWKGVEEEAQYFTSCLNDSIGFDDNKADYKRYKGVAAIHTAFRQGQPISVVVIVGKENVVWAILQNARVVPITIDASEPVETIIGLSYYAMTIQHASSS